MGCGVPLMISLLSGGRLWLLIYILRILFIGIHESPKIKNRVFMSRDES